LPTADNTDFFHFLLLLFLLDTTSPVGPVLYNLSAVLVQVLIIYFPAFRPCTFPVKSRLNCGDPVSLPDKTQEYTL
jgi:hypothetical protein